MFLTEVHPVGTRIAVLKEEGTHPLAEGLLSSFAEIVPLGSLQDVAKLAEAGRDIVLVDISMPSFDAADVLKALQAGPQRPLVVLFDSTDRPGRLLSQLRRLGRMREARPGSLKQAVRVLGVSQEALARILGVSSRTVHRWLKGARPRRNPKVEKLLRLVAVLEDVLPTPEGILSYLHHPNPSFNSETPYQLLLRGESERIAGNLQALAEGVYI